MAHRKKSKADQRQKEEDRKRTKSHERKRIAIGLGIIIVVFALIFYIVSVALVNLPTALQTGVSVGQTAPDFTVTDVNGGVFRLSDQRGKVVLLDFMGSRCPTCVAEMPHLVEIYSRYLNQDFTMISIDVGGSLGTEDASVARQFLATYGGTWQIALDNSGVALTYRATNVLPTLYLISKTGIVAFRNPGIITSADLAAQIERLI